MNVYLFIQDNYRAAAYGIGAYIRQLLCLAGKSPHLYFTVIHLHSQEKALRIEQEKDCRRIYLPSIPQQLVNMSKAHKMNEQYLRNVAFVLKVIIPDNADNIFHFQFADQDRLVLRIKQFFVGKIVLTVHYLDWALVLSGDKKHCKQVLLKPNEQLSKIEKSAKYSMERDNRLYSICDRVICISKSSQQMLVENTGIQNTQLSLIPNALQNNCCRISKCKIRRKYHIPEYAKIILFVGRLDEMKGLICLLNAFEKLLASHPEAHLVIIGDGNFKAWIKIAGSCLTKVTFTGYLQQQTLYEWYRIADMGVHPSFHEEFGYVPVEMMMHALPVIVTDTGSLSEIIDDGISGLIVPFKRLKQKRIPDIKALCDHMKWILEHSDDAKRLGRNARKKFLKTYELSNWGEKMLTLYRELYNNQNNNTL